MLATVLKVEPAELLKMVTASKGTADKGCFTTPAKERSYG
jgi:hypothetical protein